MVIDIARTHCRECKKDLGQEGFVVQLYSGGYCEKCYNYWYEYKNKRYTQDQAFYRSIGWFPYAIFPFGEIEFRKPSPKKIKAQGKMWHHHPDDWEPIVKSMLKPSEILLDGVNFPPELVATKKAKETIAN